MYRIFFKFLGQTQKVVSTKIHLRVCVWVHAYMSNMGVGVRTSSPCAHSGGMHAKLHKFPSSHHALEQHFCPDTGHRNHTQRHASTLSSVSLLVNVSFAMPAVSSDETVFVRS